MYGVYIPIEPLDMSDMKDCVCALTVKTTPQYAMKHGACKISESVSKVYPHQDYIIMYC